MKMGRATLLLLALALALPGIVGAQQVVGGFGLHYTPPHMSFTGTAFQLAYPLRFPDGSATAPSITFTNDTDTGFYLAGSNLIGMGSANSARIGFATTYINVASSAGQYRIAEGVTRYGNYFIASGESTALTDNTATTFVTMSIPQTAGSNYGGGEIKYTIFCKDASNQATETGTVGFTCQNIAGTESCTFGTPSNVIQGDATASFVAPVFSATAGSDAVAIKVQSDCTGVTPTTHTIQAFIQQQQNNTLTW
jgi:hypothetical protein